MLELKELNKKVNAMPEDLAEQVRILKEENLVLREQVRYWKWQAVSWGSPDYENFELEQPNK